MTQGSRQRPAPEQVAHALRRMRAQCYRIDTGAAGTTVALVMRASLPGRRNAAERLVALLARAGLCVLADDPVEQLTASHEPLPVSYAT